VFITLLAMLGMNNLQLYTNIRAPQENRQYDHHTEGAPFHLTRHYQLVEDFRA
jgi:hypothetical protein